MSAGQGQQVAEEVCKTLSRDRSEAAFDLFWTRLLKRKSVRECSHRATAAKETTSSRAGKK